MDVSAACRLLPTSLPASGLLRRRIFPERAPRVMTDATRHKISGRFLRTIILIMSHSAPMLPQVPCVTPVQPTLRPRIPLDMDVTIEGLPESLTARISRYTKSS